MDFISSAPYYKLTYGVLSNYLPKILKGSFDLILVCVFLFLALLCTKTPDFKFFGFNFFVFSFYVLVFASVYNFWTFLNKLPALYLVAKDIINFKKPLELKYYINRTKNIKNKVMTLSAIYLVCYLFGVICIFMIVLPIIAFLLWVWHSE